MRKIATLTAVALVAVSALGTNAAEARGGGAIAVGVIGGLAAGALLGAAVAEAREAPTYVYRRPAPVSGYEYVRPPVITERPVRIVREYDDEDVPVYRVPPVLRSYDAGPGNDGYRNAGYGYRRDCDRLHGYEGW